MTDMARTRGPCFIDGNGCTVERGDRVEYRFFARRGTLGEVLQDGEAEVLFDDTNQWEMVKWVHLCKVPYVRTP